MNRRKFFLGLLALPFAFLTRGRGPGYQGGFISHNEARAVRFSPCQFADLEPIRPMSAGTPRTFKYPPGVLVMNDPIRDIETAKEISVTEHIRAGGCRWLCM